MEGLNINLQSRQISTYGIDTMKKIFNQNASAYELKGFGLEISKNIIQQELKELLLRNVIFMIFRQNFI